VNWRGQGLRGVPAVVTTALVLLAVLAACWAGLLAGELAVRPAGLSAPGVVGFEPRDEAGRAIPGAGPHEARYYPDPMYRATVEDSGGSGAVFHIPFAVADSKSDLAFFLGATPGLRESAWNGQVIQPNVPRNALRGAADGQALYYMLPAAMIRPSGNLIEVAVQTQSTRLALAPFHIGPAEEAARATAMVSLIATTLPIMAISFLIFASLLCQVTNWPLGDRPRVRSLVALMVIWALRTWFISFQTPVEVPFLVTSFLYYGLESSLIIAFARHLLAGEALSGKWQWRLGWLWLAVLAYLAAITLAGFAVGPAVRDWFRAAAFFDLALLVIVAPAGLSALAWGLVTRRDGRWMERVTLMVCLLALAVDAGDSAFDLAVPFVAGLPLTFYAAAPVGLLLGLGVVASIAREASEARRTVVQSNQILAARLEQQDAELAHSYQAQKQMLQRQTMLEERQRIVRDMHDGIGGQLLGLLLQVRGGGVARTQVEQGLEASMADLRLIVDSMDSADGSLAETLRSFEHRARPQVEAAGLTFTVSHGLSDAVPGPGPRPTLQILRVLQEGLTNALRHAGASEVRLDSGPDQAGRARIVLIDDGRGLPVEIKGGRGLASMKNRARTIGADLVIASGDGGTRLVLTLMDQAGADPAGADPAGADEVA